MKATYTPKSAGQGYGTLHTDYEKAADSINGVEQRWTVMVEKAIVHRDKSITFVFYNGTKVRVEKLK